MTQQPQTATREPQTEASSARHLALVADKLVATEALFRARLSSDVPFIQDAGKYIADGGGKRMRPALLLLTARLLGRDGDEEVTYAAVVELIHTATLIHDDIIDNAELRRGRTSVHQMWDNNLTVLLGDWLYTTAMEMALSHGNLDVVRSLCRATLRMVEGELLALERLGSSDLTASEYFSIIDRKTANLFAAAASIPSLIGPRQPQQGEALERYGRSLGTCFQLVDDLLDFTAREDELGKPVLSDLKEGKLTLPLILLLPRVDAAERQRIEWVLADREFTRVAPGEILDIVERRGTIEEVGSMAADFAREARQALSVFPDGPALEALQAATEFVLHRRA